MTYFLFNFRAERDEQHILRVMQTVQFPREKSAECVLQ